jgi:hypothetical protein
MCWGVFQAVESAGPCPIQPDGTADAWNPNWGRDAWNVPLAAVSGGDATAEWVKA